MMNKSIVVLTKDNASPLRDKEKRDQVACSKLFTGAENHECGSEALHYTHQVIPNVNDCPPISKEVSRKRPANTTIEDDPQARCLPRKRNLSHHFIDKWRTQYWEQVYDSKGQDDTIASFALGCDNKPLSPEALWVKMAQCLSQLDNNPALWGVILAFLGDRYPNAIARRTKKGSSHVRVWADEIPLQLLIEICAMILKPFVNLSRFWPHQDFILEVNQIDFSDLTKFRHGYDPKLLAWGIANRGSWLSKPESAWNRHINIEDIQHRADFDEQSIRALAGRHLILFQTGIFCSWAQKLQGPNDAIPTTRSLQLEESQPDGKRSLRSILRSIQAHKSFYRIVLWEGDCPDSKWIHCLHREFHLLLKHCVLDISPSRMEFGRQREYKSGRMGLFLTFASMADMNDVKSRLRMVFQGKDTLDHDGNPVDAEMILPFAINIPVNHTTESTVFHTLTKEQQRQMLERYRDRGIIPRVTTSQAEEDVEGWCTFCRNSIPCHHEYFLQRHIDSKWHKYLSDPHDKQGSFTSSLSTRGIHRHGPFDQDVKPTHAWCSACGSSFSCIASSGLWIESSVDAHLKSESHKMNLFDEALRTESQDTTSDLFESYL